MTDQDYRREILFMLDKQPAMLKNVFAFVRILFLKKSGRNDEYRKAV